MLDFNDYLFRMIDLCRELNIRLVPNAVDDRLTLRYKSQVPTSRS